MATADRVRDNNIREVLYYEFHPKLQQSHHYFRIKYDEYLVISFASEEDFDNVIDALYHNACHFYDTAIMNNISLTKPPVFNNVNARPYRMKYYWQLHDYTTSVKNILDCVM